MNRYLTEFCCGYLSREVGNSLVIHADCLEWLARIPENSIHAIVTDPPYGFKEYDPEQLTKRENGQGGIWRIPPSFDGTTRSPLPRFTALNGKERKVLREFFVEWTKLSLRPLRPGANVMIAANSFLSQLVFSALAEAGLEYRGMIIRVVRTLRGGDRPKNAEEQFPNVCSMPRGCHEPWGLFRKPLYEGMRISDCLREFQTGGLRRKPDGNPFEDVIASERTSQAERKLAEHPSLKPQSFLRQVVYASLPLGEGVVVDPFMGSGSTVAAGEAVGYTCIGVDRHRQYFDDAPANIEKLKMLREVEQELPLFQMASGTL